MGADSRRPLKTRSRAWAQALARGVSRTSITPNAISLLSVGFAALAGWLLWSAGLRDGNARIACLLGAAASIQLRLLCNMLDGLVAVEGGKKGATGEIFNDFPDRVADVLILVPVGYGSCHALSVELGWLAALLAVMTAYVRMLGGSLGLKQDFCGPQGKPHRMAVLTVSCVLSCFEPAQRCGTVLYAALVVIVLGSVVTVWRRVSRIAAQLRSR